MPKAKMYIDFLGYIFKVMFNSAPIILKNVCSFVDPCTLNVCNMQSYVTCSCPLAFLMRTRMPVESKLNYSVKWFVGFLI
jgi:hypothetical protein